MTLIDNPLQESLRRCIITAGLCEKMQQEFLECLCVLFVCILSLSVFAWLTQTISVISLSYRLKLTELCLSEERKTFMETKRLAFNASVKRFLPQATCKLHVKDFEWIMFDAPHLYHTLILCRRFDETHAFSVLKSHLCCLSWLQVGPDRTAERIQLLIITGLFTQCWHGHLIIVVVDLKYISSQLDS